MKQTTKQVKAQIINELTKKYNDKYEGQIVSLQTLNKQLNAENKVLRESNDELVEKNEELVNKVLQYEEWINRLQEWCNLPDDEREKAIKQYKDNIDANKCLNSCLDMLTPYFNIFNL